MKDSTLRVATDKDVEMLLEEMRAIREFIEDRSGAPVPEYLTFNQVNQFIVEISHNTINDLVTRGKIKAKKDGRRFTRYSRDSIREYLDSNPDKFRLKRKL